MSFEKKTEGPENAARNRLLVAFLLVVITASAYWNVRNLQFINYDDNTYVTENAHVRAGVCWGSVSWAFRSIEVQNWHPLTWLTHILDYQLYGMNAAGHHVTNLLIHVANVLLLFWLLNLLSGAIWRSALVAALFAIHPLNVESVAWIAERKNLLSTFFLFTTILAYARYAARSTWKTYLPVVILFACGLMSKSMLVTLPFGLLLFDYWPLQRLRFDRSKDAGGQAQVQKAETGTDPATRSVRRTLSFLVIEKAPLFALSAASSVVTLVAQRRGGAINFYQAASLSQRVENGIVSYAVYIEKMVWPTGLAILYPYPKGAPSLERLGIAIAVLAVLSLLAFRAKGRGKYGPVGWLWYLGTMVPVIGFVQVGLQSRADRYAYVPLIGLFILVAWGLAALAGPSGRTSNWVATFAVVAVLALSLVTWRQLMYWHDSVTLFEHAVSVTQDNYVAYNNLGEALMEQGQLDEAASDFDRAIAANPSYSLAQHNAGVVLAKQGKLDDAIAHFKEALELNSRSAPTWDALGAAFGNKGRFDDALRCFNKAIDTNPRLAGPYGNIGRLFELRGQLDQALSYYYKALALDSVSESAALINWKVGNLLAKQGDIERAQFYYREALRVNPHFAAARQSLDELLNGSTGK